LSTGSATSAFYPSTLTNAQKAAAVQQACSTGYAWDWTQSPAVETSVQLTDYTAIPKAFSILPATQPIANESATIRSQAVPITYNLKVLPGAGGTALLSLAYSYNGGAFQNVITGQDITQGGTIPVPANVRFGFAGSTGGSRNIHEIMCFQADADERVAKLGRPQPKTDRESSDRHAGVFRLLQSRNTGRLAHLAIPGGRYDQSERPVHQLDGQLGRLLRSDRADRRNLHLSGRTVGA